MIRTYNLFITLQETDTVNVNFLCVCFECMEHTCGRKKPRILIKRFKEAINVKERNMTEATLRAI